MPLPDGTICPPRETDLIYFSLSEFSQEAFDLVPAGFQKMIKESYEWKELHGEEAPAPAAPSQDFDSDIPF